MIIKFDSFFSFLHKIHMNQSGLWLFKKLLYGIQTCHNIKNFFKEVMLKTKVNYNKVFTLGWDIDGAKYNTKYISNSEYVFFIFT